MLFVGTGLAESADIRNWAPDIKKCQKSLKKYRKVDKMLVAWTVTETESILWIDNRSQYGGLRRIYDYGWNSRQADSIQREFYCPNVSFKEAYTARGLPLYKKK